MTIVKLKSRIDEYRYKAKLNDINELSGRSGRHDLTVFINKQILNYIKPNQNDIVTDIGCGDGTFLKLASNKIHKGIGILPTEEEVTRLKSEIRKTLKNIKIFQGSTLKTNLPKNYADKIVCNGVFILLKNDHEITFSLKEIMRISKNNSLIYIGEIPFIDEFEKKKYGDSITKWLIWVFINQGFNQFLLRFKQVLKGLFTKEPFIITSKKHYYITPPNFIKKAEKIGLSLVEYFPSKTLSLKGELEKSRTRYDFVFTKKPRRH